MSHPKHLYRERMRGRSLDMKPGVGGPSITAHLQCARCPAIGSRSMGTVMPHDAIDKKFKQAGWRVDPHVCPDCQRKSKERPEMMTSRPSPAAMKAQAQMFHLLSTHFDADMGRYAKGWSDAKIAHDTGLAADVVAEFRAAGFGELKEAPEVAAMRAEIFALETLVAEQIAALRGDLARIAKGEARA